LFAVTVISPILVEGDEPEKVHQIMAATLDKIFRQIKKIQHDARPKVSRTSRLR